MIFPPAEETYQQCLKSGMFWEWFPELTGDYSKDKQAWKEVYKIFKKEGEDPVEEGSSVDTLTELTESPYCSNCSACGENGCCNYMMCVRKVMRNSDCDYAPTYLKYVELAKEVSNFSHNIIEKLRSKEITAEQAVEMFDENWSASYDRIHN